MRTFAIISFFALLFAGCNNESEIIKNLTPQNKITSWIEGKYLFNDGDTGFYFEEWSKKDSTEYIGKGFYLTRDYVDTLFQMKMRLLLDSKKTTMFYDVKGQNENKETEFVLTNNTDNKFVFENPFRDFPSIMEYRLLGDTLIEVTERGFVNNKEKIRHFSLTKID
ncbi:MAG: hypothetical protein J0L69_00200 [Bacteroidetes bacterium]|nr:hypothetical protein [Bacteroidota bacterium]